MMNNWAKNAIRQAIELLVKAGRNDIASDLNRVLTAVCFDELELMRSVDAEKLANSIVEADSFPQLTRLLRRVSGVIPVDHCTVHVVREPAANEYTTKVVTTYPEEWVSHYVERRYYFIDPVIHACQNNDGAFFWDDLDYSNPITRSFRNDAARFGIGPSGFSTIIDIEHNHRIAVSVSSTINGQKFKQKLSPHHSDIQNVSHLLADAFLRFASEKRPTSLHLTDDQIMVLRAVAAGAAQEDLDGLSFQYGSFATVERSILKLFRTRTLAQATVVATRIGLLDSPPLTKADVLVTSSKSATGGILLSPSAVSLRKLARVRTSAPERSSILQELPRRNGRSR